MYNYSGDYHLTDPTTITIGNWEIRFYNFYHSIYCGATCINYISGFLYEAKHKGQIDPHPGYATPYSGGWSGTPSVVTLYAADGSIVGWRWNCGICNDITITLAISASEATQPQPTPVPVPAPTVDCPTLISQYLSLLQTYDTDRNGKIEQSEANQANLDYFAGKITKDQSVAVTNAYTGNCTFTPSTIPPVTPPAPPLPPTYQEAQLLSCSAPSTSAIAQNVDITLTIKPGTNQENYKAVFSGGYTGQSEPFIVYPGSGQQNIVVTIQLATSGTKTINVTLSKV